MTKRRRTSSRTFSAAVRVPPLAASLPRFNRTDALGMDSDPLNVRRCSLGRASARDLSRSPRSAQAATLRRPEPTHRHQVYAIPLASLRPPRARLVPYCVVSRCAAVDEIKNHPFFAGVNWKTLLEKPGIFMPRPTDQYDTGYFWGTYHSPPTVAQSAYIYLFADALLAPPCYCNDRPNGSVRQLGFDGLLPGRIGEVGWPAQLGLSVGHPDERSDQGHELLRPIFVHQHPVPARARPGRGHAVHLQPHREWRLRGHGAFVRFLAQRCAWRLY